MTISSHLTTFGGYTVQQWNPGDPLPNPQTTLCRISVTWDDEQDWPSKFRALLDEPGARDLHGLVVGWWGTDDSSAEPTEVVEALVMAHDELVNLHVLFFGDITSEENEVSWIQNTDLSALLGAYPHLTHLGIRGGNGLSLGLMALPELKYLLIQSSGLDSSVVREVMNASLPSLEHLELYLGDTGYGGDSTPQDLTPLLDGQLFPKLKYLGLKNSQFQDELAQILADAPVLDGLETLDLSLGAFSDEGVKALLGSEKVKTLKLLQIRQDYPEYTPELAKQLTAHLESTGAVLDVKEENEPDQDWRYTSLSE